MIINTVKINNSKLTEGEYYWFKIIKTLDLDDNDKYYVLEDPFGYKILMPREFYVDYGFKQGQKILCRVDKINCEGQMFIEPEHPYYKEGNVYWFQYVESKEIVNFYDQKEYITIVKDVFGNKWQVKTKPGNNIVKQGEVKCYVERIRKGKLYLHTADNESHLNILTSGEYYEFVIIDEKTNPENDKTYFILEDKSKNKHLLSKKHYLKYRLKIGNTITCRVDRLSSEGYYYLEPLHPYYEIGKSYTFFAKRIDKLVYSDNKQHYALIVEDCFGDEVSIDHGENLNDFPTHKEQVECKVIDIYKGKPVLELT